MKPDVRTKNTVPLGSTIGAFAESYFSLIAKAQSTIDANALEAALIAIKTATKSKRNIFVAGNGGSAAIANHLCCDWTKGTDHPHHTPIKTHSLSANPSVMTAIGNDFSFEDVFSMQTKYFVEKEDLLILISSSGNSPNIVKAAKAAKSQGAKVIGMTGFSGGELRNLADICLHVDMANYGVVEDCHQSLMHILAQFIASERDSSK